MPAGAGSPRQPRSNGRKHHLGNLASPVNRLNFSVQDRRLNTRLLNETQRRKAQLLGLTAHDVAHQLHRYTVEPSTLMDEARLGRSSSPNGSAHPTQAMPGNGTAGSPTFATDVSVATASPRAYAPEDALSSNSKDAYERWRAQYAQYQQSKRDADPSPSVASLAGASKDAKTSVLFPSPKTTYADWIASGCPTGSWSALLHDDIYASMAAEKALLTAKYDPKARATLP